MSHPVTETRVPGGNQGPMGGYTKNQRLRCALMAGDASGPIIAATPSLGMEIKLGAELRKMIKGSPTMKPWLGFAIWFPLAREQETTEAAGFGVKYSLVPSPTAREIEKARSHEIELCLPQGGYEVKIDRAPADIQSRLPQVRETEDKKDISILVIKLKYGNRVLPRGYGVPYANLDDNELQHQVNSNHAIVNGITLSGLLEQRQFVFLVDQSAEQLRIDFCDDFLPQPVDPPLGRDHTWSRERFREVHNANPGPHPYNISFFCTDTTDDSHVAVIAHGVASDVLWVEDAAHKFQGQRFEAYFVPEDPNKDNHSDPSNRFYVIIKMTKEQRRDWKESWPRLTKSGVCRLTVRTDAKSEAKDDEWDCDIVEHPLNIERVRVHHRPKGKEFQDLVLLGRPPDAPSAFVPRKFGSRTEADENSSTPWNCVSVVFDIDMSDAKRKVESINLYQPDADPTHGKINFVDGMGLAVRDRQRLHMDLVRCRGFYDYMVSPVVDDTQSISRQLGGLDIGAQPVLRPLPSVNYLEGIDGADALLMEVLEEDRNRFRGYLGNRPLGLGLVLAGPGTGKTTILATVANVAFQRFGKTLVSGPSNVAITNIASRIYDVSATVAARYNKAKEQSQWITRRLVLRVYKANVELYAFLHILKHPEDIAKAAMRHSSFQLPYSRAYWLLVLFGAAHVGQLDENDAKALHQMRTAMRLRQELAPVFRRARGEITWKEFEGETCDSKYKGNISALLKEVLGLADFVCPTPACSENDKDVKRWKQRETRALVADEAGNMNRADLACVWGNCLLPCFLAGDPKQLPPAVMSTATDRDDAGNLRNRLSADCHISFLELFQASGFPIYRLHTQLRMAERNFDLAAEQFYQEVRCDYAPQCDIRHINFQYGRKLEELTTAWYPELKPAEPCPDGRKALRPFFIDVKGSYVQKTQLTSSRRCTKQVDAALKFISDLVRGGIPADKIVLLSPYKANVLYAEFARRSTYLQLLAKMPPASTVDSYQGQESDIVVVVFGTSNASGVGFTSQQQRLNVMLTRARCGLVLVGDIRAVEPRGDAAVGPTSADNSAAPLPEAGREAAIEGGEAAVQTKKANKNENRQVEKNELGETVAYNITAIRSIYYQLRAEGRVVSVGAAAGAQKRKADDNNDDDDADDTAPPKAQRKKGKKRNRGNKKKADGKGAGGVVDVDIADTFMRGGDMEVDEPAAEERAGEEIDMDVAAGGEGAGGNMVAGEKAAGMAPPEFRRPIPASEQTRPGRSQSLTRFPTRSPSPADP